MNNALMFQKIILKRHTEEGKDMVLFMLGLSMGVLCGAMIMAILAAGKKEGVMRGEIV
ncbi:MAG: hypothetical protein JSV11_12645 [Nitrospiraceae bacterium]|nr:MAG: hypothetical protein JSV11_12645 [Nitrospiraceae bacterium]